MVKRSGRSGIRRQHLLVAALLIAMAALALYAMGRPPICTCGTVKLWVGTVKSADNSQHLLDWYSPSHNIHGFLFYGLGWLFLRRQPLGERFVMAVAIEAAWELIENSHFIIDRYRAATFALGYSGDSIINSMSDISMMMIGFWLASRLPWKVTLAASIALELLALWAVRDNLTLNVLMLVAPIKAVKAWQAGG